jgi:hypothetical protein
VFRWYLIITLQYYYAVLATLLFHCPVHISAAHSIASSAARILAAALHGGLSFLKTRDSGENISSLSACQQRGGSGWTDGGEPASEERKRLYRRTGVAS